MVELVLSASSNTTLPVAVKPAVYPLVSEELNPTTIFTVTLAGIGLDAPVGAKLPSRPLGLVRTSADPVELLFPTAKVEVKEA